MTPSEPFGTVAGRSGDGLAGVSEKLLLDEQEASGAWLACRNFPPYRFSWIRDGTFIAHALDLRGHHDRARAFHHWVARTVLRHAHKVDTIAADLGNLSPDEPLPEELALHPRFTMEGHETDAAWGNFQLDGYGFWVTGLARHLEQTGGTVAPYRDALSVVVRYLDLLWKRPCYDCWEEYPTRRHTATLLAVAAGLGHASRLLDDERLADVSAQATSLVHAKGTVRGALVKFVREPSAHLAEGSSRRQRGAVAGHERSGRPLPHDAVDASALLVLGEFGPLDGKRATIEATLARIEADLTSSGGGVRRYLEDEYYGGGQWILLAGALAALRRQLGRTDEALAAIRWIEQQAGPDGGLPEQTTAELRYPDLLDAWQERWGPAAAPLLWSHAMYLIATST